MKLMKTILLLLYCLAYMALAHDVTLDWDDNAPEQQVTAYQVQYGTDPWHLDLMIASDVSTVKIPGLAAGTWYFAVRAINVAGASPLSPIINTVLVDPPRPPAPPTGLRVILQSSVDLKKWDDELEVLNTPPGRKFWRVQTIASN